MMKEARFWNPLPGKKVECTACVRRCQIPEGGQGFCFVRQNLGGRLSLANYGLMAAVQHDPIEKKPFNHFHPGSTVLGIGTSSCNFGCMFCQNHEISKEHGINGGEFSPEEIIGIAQKLGADGIAYTYNEPAIFLEYALDSAKLAKAHGLFNVFVTNGYLTEEAVRAMSGLVDAVVVDFKGNGDDKFANRFEAIPSAEPVKRSLLAMKRYGMHIELTDLVVPGVGDSLDACGALTKWVREELGPQTPIHFTRFYPDYKMLDYPSTPIETLKAHYKLARENGLDYVYIGNVPGNEFESTYCPKCGSVAVRRYCYQILEWNIDEKSRCKSCHARIHMVGKPKETFNMPAIKSLY